MKAGKYNIKDLFSNRYIEQIIIPEIQRDYVWKEVQVIGLFNSIIEDFKKYLSPKEFIEVKSEDKDLITAFNEFYRKRKFASNIGFIYAYNDEQYPGKYFLIDGQQRITTIFLILLALSTKKESLKTKYLSTYTINGDLKLDYRVRESAHDFAKEFVKHTLEKNSEFSDSNLYFDNKYNSDKTVSCIIQNFDIINNYLEKLQDVKLEDLYSYLEELVEFWYFDTNVSEQGEELYIYMNARGEQMQGNENIKADLLGRLSSPTLKNTYGTKWEEWQDFFWKKRGKNQNADKGFNQFLCCIAALEYYLKNDKSRIYSNEVFKKIGNVRTQDIIAELSLELIEDYFQSLKYLFDEQNSFCGSRQYADWVSKALESLWSLLNDSNINWFANYEDDNRATERRAMVYLWSVLLFVKTRKETVLQRVEVFRLLRIYYVRFNNNIRSVTSIQNEVRLQVESGIWKETSFLDERLKFNLYEKCKVDQRELLEGLIWQIEDHPLNINGQDVRNINISHLVDFHENVTIDKLQLIRDKFFEVFPTQDKNYHNIKHILLHYGRYYDESSPYYYLNLKFENWRRIIRGIGSYLKENENPFADFFSEFKIFNGTLDDFIEVKCQDKMDKEKAINMHLKLLWYSQKLGENMWQEGSAIAISKGNPCGLPNWESKDDNFDSEFTFFNTKGDLKGGTPKELSKLINSNGK